MVYNEISEEHKKVLQEHEFWIDSDGKKGARAYLREAYLREAYLYRAQLSGAYLREANLIKANLSRADLSRADLSRADLREANLIKADLSGANLSGADLSWADLYGANLIKADLSGANLYKANLYKANLYRADLSEANLCRADLREADLSGAILPDGYKEQKGAKMKNIADLTSCEIKKFHRGMERELGIKYVGDPGFIQRFMRRRFDRLITRLPVEIPDSLAKLRPMCLGKLIFLPYVPGTPKMSNTSQIYIAVHEATHATRMREFPPVKPCDWYLQYFTDGDFRALEESSAQGAVCELQYWYEGSTQHLYIRQGYALTPAQIAFAEAEYNNMVMPNLQVQRRGYTSHTASAAAIYVLEKQLGISPLS